MENAANAVANFISRKFTRRETSVLVLCGPGQNGGDGIAIARILISRRYSVKAALLFPETTAFKHDAKINFDAFTPITGHSFLTTPQEISAATASAAVIVDAIFGSGLSRPLSLHRVVQETAAARARGAFVVAVDVPSGIFSDRFPQPPNTPVVEADVTIAMGSLKKGNLCSNGKVYLCNLGVTPHTSKALAQLQSFPAKLPPRPRDASKFTFGEAIVIAGSENYFGAPFYAAAAFLRAGGGYCRLVTPKNIATVVATKMPEIVLHPIPNDSFNSSSTVSVFELVKSRYERNPEIPIVIGPGLGLNSKFFFKEFIELSASSLSSAHIVIDGDGLTHLAALLENSEWKTGGGGFSKIVLTPHPGELRRFEFLVPGLDSREVFDFVPKLASTLMQRLMPDSGVLSIVAKTVPVVIVTVKAGAEGRPEISVVDRGSTALSTPCTGDILTGVLAAFKLDCVSAVYAHGLAGEIAGQSVGEDGTTATEVLDKLPHALLRIRRWELPDPKIEEIF